MEIIGAKKPEYRAIPNTGGEKFILTAPWRIVIVWDFGYTVLTIKPGFVTDFASVPPLFRRIAGKPTDDPRCRAALLHDWLYAAKLPGVPRATADELYRDVCRSVGVPFWKRVFEWGVLRIFGGAAWREHDDEDRRHAFDRAIIDDHLDVSPDELADMMKGENTNEN
jgi:hypothetical protein